MQAHHETWTSCYRLDEVVVESVELAVGAIVSVGASGVVAEVDVLSEGVSDVDVDSPSTAWVEVELTNGNGWVIYDPLDCTAYCPSSRSPLSVS